MKKNKGRVAYRKLEADRDSVKTNEKKAAINKIKTIIILKAIIRYLNFKGNSPIFIHHYGVNHKRKRLLRQQWRELRRLE
jgi:hypothetical protein